MEPDPDADIDHGAPLPPYRQLAGILAARIRRGDWRPNRAIPSEAHLVQEYGLARATVRRAIAVLVDQGVLFVVPQRGTFVKPESKQSSMPDA
ncbi:GntR family transcriptional regulator [Micromonospora sp. HNM0581]|uniref:GntR family transcriptional regulator n=1 Tax=Micromonospora sp. HNM0581 TaxID=2716341 RepID=UPI00146C1119|nr:GntR family transcriptional regulator [Micromonospora sp. HNM0581]NLU80732.1 GntR family transcriptional regulator [Micromonospora sp. HNM0581]